MTRSGVANKIKELKEQRRAVILAHNYQVPEVQDIADFCGDSLELSLKAGRVEAEMIVFCGVYFMAETAKIISPKKTVLIPDPQAGCPMADMITVGQLKEMKAKHPKAKVLCYVNTSAEVKAECDVCCTSANAVELLNTKFEPQDEIIFVPDKYLATYAAERTGRNIIPWQGYCPSHARILPEDITSKKAEHPLAKVLAHPECNGMVLALADEVLSTSGMMRYAQKSSAKEFIIATEPGLLYPLQKANPTKKFYAASDKAVCQNMKRITLDKVLTSLENKTVEVTLPEDIILRAKRSILNMFDDKTSLEVLRKS